jgi:F0F1-type ATP synthase delta subunit
MPAKRAHNIYLFMEEAYAQALWTVIEKGMEPHDAVRALHAKLVSEGREALLPRIAHALSRIGAQMNSRDRVTLTVADKAHQDAAIKSAAASIAKLGVEERNVAVHIDSTLIGGWRLEGKQTLIDSSYKKHLLAIYTESTRS